MYSTISRRATRSVFGGHSSALAPLRVRSQPSAGLSHTSRSNNKATGPSPKPQSQSQSRPTDNNYENPEMPMAGFDELGLSPQAKRAVIAALAVGAAVEGYFWVSYARKKWGGKSEDEETADEESMSAKKE